MPSPKTKLVSFNRVTVFTWRPSAKRGWPYVHIAAVSRGSCASSARPRWPLPTTRQPPVAFTGNLAVSDRVTLFLMDYPQRTRLKILGHARVEDARRHPELVPQTRRGGGPALVERLILDRGRLLRLELSQIHHATLHCRRNPGTCGSSQTTNRRIGS